jgi:ATP phosphoribosyltransferase
MLREAGYRQRDDKDGLSRRRQRREFFYLRHATRHVRRFGRSRPGHHRPGPLVARAPVDEVLDLGQRVDLPLRARPGQYTGSRTSPARIATSSPGVVQRFLDDHEVKAEVIRLDGAVENAVGLGVADVIADVVDTGGTLRKAGLEIVGEAVLNSTAVLVRGAKAPQNGPVTQLVRRLNGVLVARQYVMLAYDVRVEALDDAVALTPGMESPTVSALHREGWVAVQAMVLRADVHRIMDLLYHVGARAILVTDILACRL